jgi:AcrR family transcriptional regulator
MDALATLLMKRNFDDISIQEIVDKADLTRATFYLHYSDKAALLQAMTSARFSEVLKKRGITSLECAGGIRTIALGVCEYLARVLDCQSSCAIPLERAVIPVLEGIFRKGAVAPQLTRGADTATFAAIVAWAIYGAAYHWAQLPNRKPAEQMAAAIETFVTPMMQAATSVR